MEIFIFSIFLAILGGIAAVGIYAAKELLGTPKTKSPKSKPINYAQPPQIPKLEPQKQTPIPTTEPIKKKNTKYDDLVDNLKKNNNWHECYEPNKLFTANEKDKHKKIVAWADRRGYITMGKVRLADLIKRRPSKEWNEPLFKKISQKHIDFVIVDKDLNPILAIEIQDSSHEKQNRMESDAFKKIVLESCGYKLLQTYDVTDEILDRAILS